MVDVGLDAHEYDDRFAGAANRFTADAAQTLFVPELAETTGKLLTVTVKGVVADTQPVTELLIEIKKSYVPMATPAEGMVTLNGEAVNVAFVMVTNPGMALVPVVMV